MNSSDSTRRNPYAVGLFLLAFLAAFFRAPFLFPVKPTVSSSYVYQFNNRAATLIFIAGVIAFAIWSRGLGLKPAQRDSRISARLCALVVLAGLTLAGFFIWVIWPFGLHGEAVYFFGRLAQLDAGKMPYRDFEFAYGPLLLYPPLWISRLFHRSLVAGYFAWWMFNWALGICILRWIINAIELPSPYRRSIFLIASFAFAVPLWALGVNYAPLRSLVSGGLAVLVFKACQRDVRPFTLAALALFSAALDSAISPEHGLAFMAGTALYFAIVGWNRRSVLVALFWSLPGFGIVVALTAKFGVYTTLRAFSAGAYNLPVMPTQDVLCVLALYVVAACAAYYAWRSGQRQTALVYLLCVSLCGLPTCFGRADSGHMQLGAYPAILIGALFLGRYRRVSWVAAVLFIYFVYGNYARNQLGDIRPAVKRRIFAAEGGEPQLRQFAVTMAHRLHQDGAIANTNEWVVYMTRLEFQQQSPHMERIADAPLGLTSNGFADRSGKIDYGYFQGLQDDVTSIQLASVIRWLQSHPERPLVLPVGAARDCYHYPEGENRNFESIYGIPWARPRRRMDIFDPLCDYIATHYAPQGAGDTLIANTIWYPLQPPAASSYASR